MLSKEVLSGKVLDIGGSKKSGYQELIKGDHEYVVANIDASYGADVIFDAESPWPVEPGSFDAVLFINVLEHLFNYRAALSEAEKALVPEGTIVAVIPFMFNVHGSPNDYYRYTRSALERIFEEAGFNKVYIEELGTGAFSVIYHCLIGFARWNWIARPAMLLAMGIDRTLGKIYPGNMLSSAYFPLGYYVRAQKLPN